MLIKLSYESILFYICKHHRITLYEVLIGPLRFRWLQWQTVKHILRFLRLATSGTQRISCFVPVAFFTVFFTFYIAAALSQRLWCLRCCLNKELNQTFKVSKLFTFDGEIFHSNNYSWCCIIFLALPQQLWPLCRWSQTPVLPLNITFPPTCHCLLLLFQNLLWEREQDSWTVCGKRWTIGGNMFSQEICCLPKLAADWSQGSKHFLSEEKAWFLACPWRVFPSSFTEKNTKILNFCLKFANYQSPDNL